MIPKTIHYCWLSKDKKPNLVKRCMATWKDIMPDYQIKCWDMNNIQDCSIPYVKEAISVKQYAFAADYIRLFALYSEGGIYLDSDVEVLKAFNPFLDNHFFCGTEAVHFQDEIAFDLEAAIMGSEPNHPFVKECMNYYEKRHFIQETGVYDSENNVMPWVISGIAKNIYGYDYQNKEYHFNDGFTIYSTNQFTNNLCLEEYFTPNTYAIHRNAASWRSMEHRGRLFHFCRKHNLMNLYGKIEKINTKK